MFEYLAKTKSSGTRRMAECLLTKPIQASSNDKKSLPSKKKKVFNQRGPSA
jgi:hypothetical protein